MLYALDRFKARPPWILISWQHKSTMIREISKTLWNVQHWNCNQWYQLRCKYCPNRKYYSKQKYHKVQVSVVVYRWTSSSEMWLRLPHNIVIPDTDRNHSSRRNNGVFSINPNRSLENFAFFFVLKKGWKQCVVLACRCYNDDYKLLFTFFLHEKNL